MDRVCIFIDGSNLYHQLKDCGTNIKINYYNLSKALAEKERKLIRTYYYVCPPVDPNQKSYHDQQKFLSYLKNTQYLELRFGSLEVRGNVQVEKGVDVMLAIDMVSLAHKNAYDTAILLSNDSDLAPAVDMVKDLGKHVEYAYISQKTVRLIESCDVAVQIDSKILQQSKSKK
jgi:uncharacterized LabA/DUF88 family protein